MHVGGPQEAHNDGRHQLQCTIYQPVFFRALVSRRHRFGIKVCVQDSVSRIPASTESNQDEQMYRNSRVAYARVQLRLYADCQCSPGQRRCCIRSTVIQTLNMPQQGRGGSTHCCMRNVRDQQPSPMCCIVTTGIGRTS